MKSSRREFLLSSLGFGLGAYAQLGLPSGARANTNGKQPLGYRFSSPQEDMKSHYSTVVVGSGYGASVIAARLADKDMCVLERGREWHPGEFPENPQDLVGKVKGPLDPLGLIDIEQGSDIDIICGNGLGGTSLLNAAIAIRPEFNLFDLPVWPTALREEARNGKLEGYYQKAESILQPTTLNQQRFRKVRAHKSHTEAAGRSWGELKLNIRP